MRYTPGAIEYIDSVHGDAHQSGIEIIERLEAENKAIKETLLKTLALNTEHILWIKALKQSKDELLGALKEVAEQDTRGEIDIGDLYYTINDTIQKAKALKKEEKK